MRIIAILCLVFSMGFFTMNLTGCQKKLPPTGQKDKKDKDKDKDAANKDKDKDKKKDK